MTRRPVRRLAAALVNLLFLLAWGEPAMLPPCPAHDGTAFAAYAAQTGAAQSTAAHGGHGAHGMTDVALASHGSDHGSQDAHACRCLGQCCAAVAVTVPVAQAIRWQVVVRRLVEPPAAEPTAPAARTVRLLPFANGPPRTA
jgi:hypothetical protein